MTLSNNKQNNYYYERQKLTAETIPLKINMKSNLSKKNVEIFMKTKTSGYISGTN
jgi:hypothetical protein